MFIYIYILYGNICILSTNIHLFIHIYKFMTTVLPSIYTHALVSVVCVHIYVYIIIYIYNIYILNTTFRRSLCGTYLLHINVVCVHYHILADIRGTFLLGSVAPISIGELAHTHTPPPTHTCIHWVVCACRCQVTVKDAFIMECAAVHAF